MPNGSFFEVPYILENFCADRVGIVSIDGIDYFSFLQQVEWEKALAEANHIFSYRAGEKWTEDHCKAVVTPLIKENAREFRRLFWKKATKLCHFAENDVGQRVLIAYGRGADQVIEAVLSDSERPLHYSEIAERASERQGRPIDKRLAHTSAAAVGVLFARGTYGLAKHVALSPEDVDLIREEAESIVLAGPPGRQWHAAEISTALLDRDIPTAGLDKYILDFLLRRSDVLQRLGRMTWIGTRSEEATSADRINIHQTIISLVEEAGRPLSTSEIRQRLIALQGVSERFQIAAVDPLIRLGTAEWGLNDRDVPIKRCDQPVLLEYLVKKLQRNSSGIHISEIEDVALQAWPGLTAQMIFSLAILDARMRVGAGQYLYLEAWGTPRRATLSEALQCILAEATYPLTLEDITARATHRLEREQEKGGVSRCLQSLGAIHDPGNRTWVLSAGEVDEADEEDFAAERTAVNGDAGGSNAEALR